MQIQVKIGDTFLNKDHYITQAQQQLDFIPPSFRDAMIKYVGQQYAARISWSGDGDIKGIRLPQSEFERFVAVNKQITQNSIITIGIELNLPDSETFESLPIRPGMSEIEFDELQKKKKFIGKKGEESVVYFEKKKLTDIGRYDLAKKVIRVSKSDIGLGYDILSYDSHGKKMFIEVKTTTGSANGFEFTRNEKIVCNKLKSQYYIYFIKNYRLDLGIEQAINIDVITGLEFEKRISLKPSCYSAQLI